MVFSVFIFDDLTTLPRAAFACILVLGVPSFFILHAEELEASTATPAWLIKAVGYLWLIYVVVSFFWLADGKSGL